MAVPFPWPSGDGNILVIALPHHSLEVETVQAVVVQTRRLADRDAHLDFGDVVFVTGSSLGRLVTLHKQLQVAGGRLVLVNVNPLIQEVFAITGLTKFLDVRPHVSS